MTTDRRAFIQTAAAGAAGIALLNALPLAAQGTAKVNRKMVVRADDIGMSKFCNIGSFEAIENGVVTAADVMLDSPGTEDALERLTKFPWLSVGWHTHMWGAPVADPKRVPSLIEKSGEFAGRFRTDLSQAQDVVFEEALLELRAQMERCVKILGKAPDTGGGGRGTAPWGRAMAQVSEQFGLIGNFTVNAPPNAKTKAYSDKYNQRIRDAKAAGEEWAKYYNLPGAAPAGAPAAPAAGRGGAPNAPAQAPPQPPAGGQGPDPQFAARKIIMPAGTFAYIDLLTDSIGKVEQFYDPVLFYTEDRVGILDYPPDYVFAQAWHPGYVDYYTYRLGERANRPRAQQFVVGRTQDVAAMCDPRLKNWIKQNRIELVSFRDAMYGRSDYQDHLKVIGSDLYMRG